MTAKSADMANGNRAALPRADALSPMRESPSLSSTARCYQPGGGFAAGGRHPHVSTPTGGRVTSWNKGLLQSASLKMGVSKEQGSDLCKPTCSPNSQMSGHLGQPLPSLSSPVTGVTQCPTQEFGGTKSIQFREQDPGAGGLVGGAIGLTAPAAAVLSSWKPALCHRLRVSYTGGGGHRPQKSWRAAGPHGTASAWGIEKLPS